MHEAEEVDGVVLPAHQEPHLVYWQANTVSPRNQVLTESLGANITTSRTIDAVTGELRAISRSNGSTNLQNLGFLYDKVGSLIQRQDNRLGLTEDLTYDNLHRIETSKVGATTYNYDFDALGNVTLKTDLGTGLWNYDPVKKHQLLSAAGGAVTYTYDANGNAITRNGQVIDWTSFNYPSRVRKSGTEYNDFFYGPNRERWKQIYVSPTATETTISLGKYIEKVTSGGSTDWRHYLFVGEQPVAVYSRTSSGSNTVRYILEDHQASIAALASSAGTLIVNESFQPFGQRRNGSTWQVPIPSADLTTISSISRRGYTDHNDLGAVPLIHMNGRVQDPMTGRFLSADPYVSSPMSTHGWNRYAYVENNPATFTDPTGFAIRTCANVPRTAIGYRWVYTGGGGDPNHPGGWTLEQYEIIVNSQVCRDVPVNEVLPQWDLDLPTCGSDCMRVLDRTAELLYDYFPGYKAGTCIYNRAWGESCTVWEVVDLASSAVAVGGYTLKVINAANSARQAATAATAASEATTAARGAAQLTGQMHHGISRTVHKALEAHPNLKGLYSARDSRFVTQAKDLASHRGYDTFHRNLDAEVAGWVRANPSATQAQFETYLRGVYQRADVLERFPNGL